MLHLQFARFPDILSVIYDCFDNWKKKKNILDSWRLLRILLWFLISFWVYWRSLWAFRDSLSCSRILQGSVYVFQKRFRAFRNDWMISGFHHFTKLLTNCLVKEKPQEHHTQVTRSPAWEKSTDFVSADIENWLLLVYTAPPVCY